MDVDQPDSGAAAAAAPAKKQPTKSTIKIDKKATPPAEIGDGFYCYQQPEGTQGGFYKVTLNRVGDDTYTDLELAMSLFAKRSSPKKPTKQFFLSTKVFVETDSGLVHLFTLLAEKMSIPEAVLSYSLSSCVEQSEQLKPVVERGKTGLEIIDNNKYALFAAWMQGQLTMKTRFFGTEHQKRTSDLFEHAEVYLDSIRRTMNVPDSRKLTRESIHNFLREDYERYKTDPASKWDIPQESRLIKQALAANQLTMSAMCIRDELSESLVVVLANSLHPTIIAVSVAYGKLEEFGQLCALTGCDYFVVKESGREHSGLVKFNDDNSFEVPALFNAPGSLDSIRLFAELGVTTKDNAEDPHSYRVFMHNIEAARLALGDETLTKDTISKITHLKKIWHVLDGVDKYKWPKTDLLVKLAATFSHMPTSNDIVQLMLNHEHKVAQTNIQNYLNEEQKGFVADLEHELKQQSIIRKADAQQAKINRKHLEAQEKENKREQDRLERERQKAEKVRKHAEDVQKRKEERERLAAERKEQRAKDELAKKQQTKEQKEEALMAQLQKALDLSQDDSLFF